MATPDLMDGAVCLFRILLTNSEKPDSKPKNDSAGEGGTVATNRLDVGGTLGYGDRLVSNSKEWTLLFEGNGNLVLYNNGTPYWQTDTTNNSSGTGSINAHLEGDGNLVVGREGGGPHLWKSGSNGFGAKSPYILVQDDGNVCLYDEEVEGCHWAARDI